MNRHLLELAPEEMKQRLRAIDHTVSQTLIALSIFPYRKGHSLIKDGVLYCMTRYASDLPADDLYRSVALWHQCSPKAVESNIRSAIRAADNMGALVRLDRLLGVAVVNKSYPLSNLQFISLLAQYCCDCAEPPLPEPGPPPGAGV